MLLKTTNVRSEIEIPYERSYGSDTLLSKREVSIYNSRFPGREKSHPVAAKNTPEVQKIRFVPVFLWYSLYKLYSKAMDFSNCDRFLNSYVLLICFNIC